MSVQGRSVDRVAVAAAQPQNSNGQRQILVFGYKTPPMRCKKTLARGGVEDSEGEEREKREVRRERGSN